MTMTAGIARHGGQTLGEVATALETLGTRQDTIAAFVAETVTPAFSKLLPRTEVRDVSLGVPHDFLNVLRDANVIKPGGAGAAAWNDTREAVAKLVRLEANVADGLPDHQAIRHVMSRYESNDFLRPSTQQFLAKMDSFAAGEIDGITIARGSEHAPAFAPFGYKGGDHARMVASDMFEQVGREAARP